MRNDAQKHQDDGVPSNGRSGGNGFFSVRSLSNYMRIVSSGASNVASNVRSAGASIVSSINRQDDAGRDQVPLGAFWSPGFRQKLGFLLSPSLCSLYIEA
ncbi:hypothetical protein GW17_00010384 [Ensete ventricosum]|uniref:Uncharacterized protein n=1 Tax=Ensete ventricosum TaxID=4639 RepID=A0A444FRN4_ENSVE|nr:hypothetical protein B296_00022315 [Ensete ventricosum]RWW25283.1 hypothetical protein GW17_00010384 [Ensete ventricosum]